MVVNIARWGNSLAVRIPAAFAAQLGVVEGALADLSVENGRLVVTPVEKRRYVLADLLEGISDENLHVETDTGAAVGNEYA
jgi:antitoxin MazE